MLGLDSLSPTPAFPNYTGPYKVGTVDLEVPLSELDPATLSPDPAVSTLSARIYYPCQDLVNPPAKTYWYPQPQQDYFAAYLQFLGTSSRLSQFISYFPRILYNIQIPVLSNVPLLQPPTTTSRWPTMIFSHGLGGTRNMYSHLCGSMASHGVVVIAPEHRDGSAPITFVRNAQGKTVHTVPYQKIGHDNCIATQEGRNKQLRQRLWEMGEAYVLAQAIDKGVVFSNYAAPNGSRKSDAHLDLACFKDSLNAQIPGSVHFAGHSFGAVTALQFVKSVYYDAAQAPASYQPLYAAPRDSQIVRQVTPNTNLTLLDCWMLPTLDPMTRWLHDKPIPAYTEGGPGGNAILAVLSEGFYRWNDNLMEHKRAVSPDPSLQPRDWTPERMADIVAPHIFYPVKSAHLSQSDFGVLFPWLAKKAFKAEEPERTVKLNTRAILEVWRNNGAELANTSKADMEAAQVAGNDLQKSHEIEKVRAPRRSSSSSTLTPAVATLRQDEKVLLKDGSVHGWIALSLSEEDTEIKKAGPGSQPRKDPGRVLKEEA